MERLSSSVVVPARLPVMWLKRIMDSGVRAEGAVAPELTVTRPRTPEWRRRDAPPGPAEVKRALYGHSSPLRRPGATLYLIPEVRIHAPEPDQRGWPGLCHGFRTPLPPPRPGRLGTSSG